MRNSLRGFLFFFFLLLSSIPALLCPKEEINRCQTLSLEKNVHETDVRVYYNVRSLMKPKVLIFIYIYPKYFFR